MRSWWRRDDRSSKKQAEKQVGDDQPDDSSRTQAAALGPLPNGVALDVGFAALSIGMGTDGRPSLLSIEARDGTVTDEGNGALQQMMDNVLSLPDMSGKYLFMCDLRSLTWPQPDMIASLRHWGCDPERQERWRTCCESWTIVVPEGVYYYGACLALGHFFFSHPPMCTTYLVTDPLEVGIENVVQFDPEPVSDAFSTWVRSLLEGEESNLLNEDEWREAGAPIDRESPSDAAKEGAAAKEGSASSAAEAASDLEPLLPADGSTAPDSVNVGFMVAAQVFREDIRRADLSLTGRSGAATVEKLDRVLAFMDRFSRICNVKNVNFTTTYDFRELSMPPLKMVKKLAEWGNEPERAERWTRLNNACKVVVGSGFVYVLSKSILNTYFYACPPVCRTYILTDPDEPEEGAFFFDPAPKKGSQEGDEPSQEAAVEEAAPSALAAREDTRDDGQPKASTEQEASPLRVGEASSFLEPDDEFQADAALHAKANMLKTRTQPGPGMGGVR